MPEKWTVVEIRAATDRIGKVTLEGKSLGGTWTSVLILYVPIESLPDYRIGGTIEVAIQVVQTPERQLEVLQRVATPSLVK